jgi:hypothetical protein
VRRCERLRRERRKARDERCVVEARGAALRKAEAWTLRAERRVDANSMQNVSVHCEQEKGATHTVPASPHRASSRTALYTSCSRRGSRPSQRRRSCAIFRAGSSKETDGEEGALIRGCKKFVLSCVTTRREEDALAPLRETEDLDAPLEFGGVFHEKRE